MVKKCVDAKVRPLANPSLERASLLGAARLYISKDTLIALTGNLENGRHCIVERLQIDADEPFESRRCEASLYILPEKNISPNVVMMTRAFQEASGLRLGDQVRLSLGQPVTPEAEEVIVQDMADAAEQKKEASKQTKHPASWEFAISMSLDRAEQVFPGMVFEGVSINKLRRTFKIISVNGQDHNIARFRLASTTVRILNADEDKDADTQTNGVGNGKGADDTSRGELVVTGVPGLTSQVGVINQFLRGFSRPFWVKDERESCGFVIHGGHGTGKTFILQRIAATNWGAVHWVRASDKLSTLRETFKQAQSQQPCMIFIDGLDDLVSKERANRDSIIEVLGEELDALSAAASAANALPRVVVIATCLDYMTDLPGRLQKRSRFRENVALPIPRATERLEILRFLDPPIQSAGRDACLLSVAQKTHAYNGDDLANLVLNAKKILGSRLDDAAAVDAAVAAADAGNGESDGGDQKEQQQQRLLTSDDMEQALRITRPTAMHDINLKPPTIHWQDVGGQESLKKVLRRMIKNAKVGDRIAPTTSFITTNIFFPFPAQRPLS